MKLHLEDGRRVPMVPDEAFLFEADADPAIVRTWKKNTVLCRSLRYIGAQGQS